MSHGIAGMVCSSDARCDAPYCEPALNETGRVMYEEPIGYIYASKHNSVGSGRAGDNPGCISKDGNRLMRR